MPNTPIRCKRTKRSTPTAHEIIAPAGGTRTDVRELAHNLGLDSNAVEAILNCQGAGIAMRSSRSSGDLPIPPVTLPNDAPTPWGDFMCEAIGTSATGEAIGTSATIEVPIDTIQKEPPKLEPPTTPKSHSTPNDVTAPRHYHLPIRSRTSLLHTNKSPTPYYTPILPGILAQTGTLDASLPGRSKTPLTDDPRHISSPTLLTLSLFRTKIACIATSSSSCHSFCIDVNGQVYGWGRNESSQLGSPACASVTLPTLVTVPVKDNTTVPRFISAAVGKSHSILVDEEGKTYACGSNKVGQCGVSRSMEVIASFKQCVVVGTTAKTREEREDVTIVQASCGEQFSVLLSNMGHIYSAGLAEFGQLGNGETGEYFLAANKLAFTNSLQFHRRAIFASDTPQQDSKISQIHPLPDSSQIAINSIACGKNHTIAIEAPCHENSHSPRVFTWGCGDYGCLGHAIQADEYTPRLVATLQGPVFRENIPLRAAAGTHHSMVITDYGHVYYWGKHKVMGEATMRPHLVSELADNGHVVKTFSGGHATVFCATQDGVTVSWGAGPYGELGYGTNGQKSSSKPKFVDSLDQCLVTDVQCGYGHTLLLLQNETKADMVLWKKLKCVEAGDVPIVEDENENEDLADSKFLELQDSLGKGSPKSKKKNIPIKGKRAYVKKQKR